MPSHALPPAALPVAGLLPNQPALAVGRQQTLTRQHLLPALPALEAYLLALREQIDPPLRQHKPIKLGKPYPLGQCLEICKAMQAAFGFILMEAVTVVLIFSFPWIATFLPNTM